MRLRLIYHTRSFKSERNAIHALLSIQYVMYNGISYVLQATGMHVYLLSSFQRYYIAVCTFGYSVWSPTQPVCVEAFNVNSHT